MYINLSLSLQFALSKFSRTEMYSFISQGPLPSTRIEGVGYDLSPFLCTYRLTNQMPALNMLLGLRRQRPASNSLPHS